MDLQTLKKVETREQYNAVRLRVDELIKEATEKGMLESDADNDYIREIGRLGRMGAQYETDYYPFTVLKVRKKSPLIKSIEDEMYSRNIKQKELAEILGVNAPTLSQVMRGKRAISLRMAKRLYTSLHIDPALILECV
jgi:antitoxin component HigA of HigAB toxin-antitoxin module